VARTALAAIGTVGHTKLAHHLLLALSDKQRWQIAADSLVALGPAVVPLLQDALGSVSNLGNVLTHRFATVLERLDPPPAARY
jgi:hypothetical protein